ncbi:FCS-Like Zinc finger 10-like [Senna tora]|uniref:FCS-Like Zinc finger 10-like n=1 Tax=Senna tora TaxID=362788 RepID=A0A834T8S5_9FABA|nr:FCS-Like Zinc finger 10-like [Senna tora]
MLRKRTRSHQKDQNLMGHLSISNANREYYSQSHHVVGSKLKNNSIFNVPRLFVGLVPNSLLDSDSIRSPTSPLDVVKMFPKSLHREGQNQRSWDCCKVGLSIIDSLEDSSRFSEKILPSSESKDPIISPRVRRIKSPNCLNYTDSFEASKSLPKDFCKLPYTQNGSATILNKGVDSNVLFEIGETHLEHEPLGKTRSCSLDSCSPFKPFPGSTGLGGSDNSNTSLLTELNSNHVSISSSHEFIESLSAGEIENSEDYTCVISHGPNPKTTRIFGDCILETHSDDLRIFPCKSLEKENGLPPVVVNCSQSLNQYLSNDFLSFCYHCNKKLEEGKDIYMYRGEKAFCSLTCRALEIMIDEELEKSDPSENSPEPEIGEELFETGILTT